MMTLRIVLVAGLALFGATVQGDRATLRSSGSHIGAVVSAKRPSRAFILPLSPAVADKTSESPAAGQGRDGSVAVGMTSNMAWARAAATGTLTGTPASELATTQDAVRVRSATSVVAFDDGAAASRAGVTACQHAITLWDYYGDGWTGGYIDVYVEGVLVLSGLTLADGAGPETVYIDAATGDQISTVWFPGDFPVEAEYCIYDVAGTELGCDGQNIPGPPITYVEPTGITVTANCDATGACCDLTNGTCTDDVEVANCAAPLQFTHMALCADLDPSCGNPGSCCDTDTGLCTQEFEVNCNGWFNSDTLCGDLDPPCGIYHACRHSITLWEDDLGYWAQDYVIVYVNDVVVLPHAAIDQGEAPPKTYYFEAGDDDEIRTVWFNNPNTSGDYRYSYCIYDGAGNELGCDGLGGTIPIGITVSGACVGSGACCDPSDGSCTSNVDVWDCAPPLTFTLNTHCDDLDPGCGSPGACCDQAAGTCVNDVLAVNCAGRHAPGQACEDAPFTPACGAVESCKTLIAVAETAVEYAGGGAFMAELAARTFSTVDFFDATAATPTLEYLQDYRMVFTYADNVFADKYAMGDVLADYVESGGKVVLGQYTPWLWNGNRWSWLDGRIMDEYMPAYLDSPIIGPQSYAMDGTDCAFDGVGAFKGRPYHIAGTIGEAAMDGTYLDERSSPLMAYRLDRSVYFVAGHLAGYIVFSDQHDAEWAQLTANICYCEPEELYGACCDPFTGSCTDDVVVANCQPPMQWTQDTLCADLETPCSTTGACCVGGVCTDGLLERNCDGRFEANATCASDPFQPSCTQGGCNILYAPSEIDDPHLRAELAAITASNVDYYDASAGTPTPAELQAYDLVITWTNLLYADSVAFGDALADFVESGGRVVLGRWAHPGGQGAYLEGRLMSEYSPVSETQSNSAGYNGGAYMVDGTDCIHEGVSVYGTPVSDRIVSVPPSAWTDGTQHWEEFITGGYVERTAPAVAYRNDRKTFYLPGFGFVPNVPGRAELPGYGDWAKLIANICDCPPADLIGACCDPASGTCTDDASVNDCQPPLAFSYNTACADLSPACGNPGACCDDLSGGGGCADIVEAQCNGRFMPGAECSTDPFTPPCGTYDPCGHTITMWDDYGDGWQGASLDLYVGGLLRQAGIALETGGGPTTVQFLAEAGEEITTVWNMGIFDGGWDFECTYCISGSDGSPLGCDGILGVQEDPTGITVNGACTDLVCGNGVCQMEGGESCLNCPADCGACTCLEQAPDGMSAYLSDTDCQACGSYPMQLIAENFRLFGQTHITGVSFNGSYTPDNLPPEADRFTVVIHSDAAGKPGAAVASFGPTAGTRSLYAPDVYYYTIDIDATLEPETYWIEIHNDTVDNTDTWAWETGTQDPTNGLPGAAYAMDQSGFWGINGSINLSLAFECDAPSLLPPQLADAPHDILKNRYISVDPLGASGSNPSNLHIRVMVDSSQVNGLTGSGPWWANPPVNGGGLSPATCISVVTTTKPASEPDWSGCATVHLTGCPIVPTTTYAIAVESGGELSADALFDTQAKPGVKWHGDCVGFFDGAVWTPPNAVTSIDDAVAGIKTFQDPNAFNATHLSVTDVHPNLNGDQINLIVSIGDVFAIILGFQGQEYPGADLTQCP